MLVGRRFDGCPQVIGSKVEEHQPGIELGQLEQVLRQPVQALDLALAQFEELGARFGIVPGLFHQQLVEGPQRCERGPELVRHVRQEVTAPVAVPPDQLDALGQPVGHGVELDRQFAKLRGPFTELRRRHATGQITFREPAGGVGELADGRREAPGERRRDHDGKPEGEQSDREQQAGDVVDRRGPIGVWVGEGDLHGVLAPGLPAGDPTRDGRPFARLAGGRWGLARQEYRPVGRFDESRLTSVVDRQSEADDHVSLRGLIGDEVPDPIGLQGVEDARIHDAIRIDDQLTSRRCVRDQPNVRADGGVAFLQVTGLLPREVVVEPVDDDHGDQPERERDDHDEGHAQPRLERARHQPPDAAQPGEPPDHRPVSVLRRRTRRPARSGRTPASPDRPRSSRGGG